MAHKAPAVFIGHGSPMLALANTEAEKRLVPSERALNACYADGVATAELHSIGEKLLAGGKPKAILAVSAHWYTPGTRVQTSKDPRQVYDMYGFPEELYRVEYPVAGFPNSGKRSCTSTASTRRKTTPGASTMESGAFLSTCSPRRTSPSSSWASTSASRPPRCTSWESGSLPCAMRASWCLAAAMSCTISRSPTGET